MKKCGGKKKMDLKVYLKEKSSSEDTVYLHPIKADRMK
jgi:hypothetical protein